MGGSRDSSLGESGRLRETEPPSPQAAPRPPKVTRAHLESQACQQTGRHHLTNISGNTDLCVRPSSHFLSVGLQASPCPLSWEHSRGRLWAAEWAEEGSNPRLTLGLGIHLWGPLFLLEMRKMAAPLKVTVKRVTTKVRSRCLACGNCSGIPGRNGGVGRRRWALSGCSGWTLTPALPSSQWDCRECPRRW